ncbi:hypothetical protein FRACA_580020 [Frankia canadensis]|uniref:Uncharacterized protein n=1 Tax=Frankia canadensis TaxID=1836972 RepID=A0A2I2KZ86_9ACTN|nr:hypothetical protein FRACA_580020 [Frankia canadensis]SOU58259.1 hypothetical protein FRACA_580020 [Frankia canadensis]
MVLLALGDAVEWLVELWNHELLSGVTSTGDGWNGSVPLLELADGLGVAGWLVAGLAGSNGRLPSPDVWLLDAVGLAEEVGLAEAVVPAPVLGMRPRRSVGPVAACSSRGTSVITGMGPVVGLTVVVSSSGWSALGASWARGGVVRVWPREACEPDAPNVSTLVLPRYWIVGVSPAAVASGWVVLPGSPPRATPATMADSPASETVPAAASRARPFPRLIGARCAPEIRPASSGAW